MVRKGTVLRWPIALAVFATACVDAPPLTNGNQPTMSAQAKSSDGLQPTSDDSSTDTSEADPGAGLDLRATCGLVVFDGWAIDLELFEPYTGEIAEIVGASAQGEYQASSAWWDSLSWSVVEQSESSLLLIGQRHPPNDGPSFAYARFAQTEEEWSATGWGDCAIKMEADGFGVAEFALDPNNPPNPAEAILHLLVTERACASGQAPMGREILPVVVESAGAVEITVLVESPSWAQTCQGNPAFPLSVSLGAPLSDRMIRDTAIHPPTDRPWPLEPRASELDVWIAGDPPATGTANVFAWTGEHSGALMVGSADWSRQPTWFQSFGESQPTMISGFVTACDPTRGCEEEYEGEAYQVLPRLGPECSASFTPVPSRDTIMTIHFTGLSCTIEVSTAPID